MTNRSGVLLKKPLFYVLTSIRFQPWLLLPKRIAEIQDLLRERFPIVSQIIVEQWAQRNDGGTDPDATARRPVAWTFHQADRRIGCQISVDSIMVHALEYERFDAFAEIVAFVVNAVESSAKHLDVNSIGIRYLDMVSPRAGETLSEYVPQQFVPYAEVNTDFIPSGGHSQSTYKTAEGILQARFWSGEQFLSVPDDLVPSFMLTQDWTKLSDNPIPSLGPQQGILDTDSIWNSSEPVRMNSEKIVRKLEVLHAHSNSFFRSVCSEHAFRVWQGEV